MRKSAIGILAVMVGMAAVSAPVKSNVAGETIIRNGENLPYDAEVEYLQSRTASKNYIEIKGFKNIPVRFRIEAKSLVNTYNTWLTGFVTSRLGIYSHLEQQITVDGIKYGYTPDIEYKGQDDSGYLIFEQPQPKSWDVEVCIFCQNYKGWRDYSTARIKSFILFDGNGKIVLDLIPVRVGTGDKAVGYMYDRVTGNLYGNSGTGADFVIGPDRE